MIPLSDLMWTVRDRCLDTKDTVEGWLFDSKKAAYGAAACRITLGAAILLLLGGNFSTRQLWVGPASIWADPVRAVSRFPELGILNGATSSVVTLVYLFVLFSAFAFTIGWHTRVATIFTLIGFIGIVGQNPTVGNQGDNLIRLSLLWMLLIDSSARWSLDAGRRVRTPAMSTDTTAMKAAWNGHETVPRWLANSVHNIGIAGLAAQTILVYTASGFAKIADPAWRHGTALYTTMQLPDYRPFPPLSDAFSQSRVLLALITYAILFAQLFFAAFLLNKVTRFVIIALVIVVNVFFGLIMALPVSSLAILAATAIFVSGSTWESIVDYIKDLLTPTGYWLADRWDDARDKVDDLRRRPAKTAAVDD